MTLNPITMLEMALKVNRPAATIIVVGLAAFAAAGAFAALGIKDPAGAMLSVIYIVGASLLISMIAFAFNNPFAARALSWAVTVVIVFFMGSVALGAIVYGQTLVNPPSCILRFWEPCTQVGGVLDQIAASQAPVAAPPPVAAAATTPGATPTPPDVPVYLRFSGLISRENAQKVTAGLAAQGWNMQETDTGGRRVGDNDRINVVLYSTDTLQAAATTLAAQLTATGIAKGAIAVRKETLSVVPAGQLQAWVRNS